ncbi:hypothetical protein [uncultured Shewanella sp.]|uniref:hypothetical protein n=1 Tax=uncultured Shewanella sp. TaxID=173975 RepID=UPI0026224B5E|nr:hypothetical protein [uncultured Shewanella sp.]
MDNKLPNTLNVSPIFMTKYDHIHPSGTLHPLCLRHRLANIGVDARKHLSQQLDLNLLTDRQYQFIVETSDDGWLIGGGDDTKLKRADTAHAEIWRTGPDNFQEGGIPYSLVHQIMSSIAFAPIILMPSRVNLTDTHELELLFEYESASTIGQLFACLSQVMACPCGDYGNPFHITLVRGVKFRSKQARGAYFKKINEVVSVWIERFPNGIQFGDGGVDFFANREEILFHYPPTRISGVEADITALKSIIKMAKNS